MNTKLQRVSLAALILLASAAGPVWAEMRAPTAGGEDLRSTPTEAQADAHRHGERRAHAARHEHQHELRHEHQREGRHEHAFRHDGKYDGKHEGEHRHEGKRGAGEHRRHGAGDAMQSVPHLAAASEPGAGWRYFSDAQARRAVVISPEGEYYLSHGHGLRKVGNTPVPA